MTTHGIAPAGGSFDVIKDGVIVANFQSRLGAEQYIDEVERTRPERCVVCGGLNSGDVTHTRCM